MHARARNPHPSTPNKATPPRHWGPRLLPPRTRATEILCDQATCPRTDASLSRPSLDISFFDSPIKKWGPLSSQPQRPHPLHLTHTCTHLYPPLSPHVSTAQTQYSIIPPSTRMTARARLSKHNPRHTQHTHAVAAAQTKTTFPYLYTVSACRHLRSASLHRMRSGIYATMYMQ